MLRGREGASEKRSFALGDDVAKCEKNLTSLFRPPPSHLLHYVMLIEMHPGQA